MPLDVRKAWQRYHAPVREKCRRVLGDGDEASDVAQETFIRFWKSGAGDDARVALAWLYQTAIGIIDSCRGGGWTQAKGLTPTAPPSRLESRRCPARAPPCSPPARSSRTRTRPRLQGSFFTHHLVAGLRGAADATGDGQVTLSEAFAYANRLTIRDTARRSREAQHPSFDLRLRGRQDVVLTSLAAEDTQLLVAQQVGPLEVVQLSTGVTVAEAAPGEQLLRLALPPGPYLVRRVKDGTVYSREVTVRANEAVRLEESSLTLVGQQQLATKGPRRAAGRNELALSFTSAPFEPFLVNLGGNVDFTWYFVRNFGVTPTAFTAPRATVHTALTFEPTHFEAGATSLRGGLVLGGGVRVDDTRALTLPRLALYAAIVFGAELQAPVHLVALNLGAVVDFGPPR
jgi:hypothetical protein